MSNTIRKNTRVKSLPPSALVAVVVVTFSGLLTGNAASQELVNSNPHVPPFVDIDGGEYLRLRAEHIGLLRGLPHPDPSVRILAVQEMDQQMERHLERELAAGTPSVITAPWTPIGPAPIPNGQTTSVSTAVSGRVTAIDVHPTNPNIAYVGTAQGGVYRTLDGGTTWTPLTDTALSLAIGAVSIDPADPTIVFVGTGEGNLSLDSFFGVGLYRINSADTTPVLNGPFETRIAGTGTTASNGHAFLGTSINKIVVDPTDHNRIYIGNTFGGGGVSGDGICCGGTTPPSAFIGLYFSENALAATPVFSHVNIPSFNGLQDVTDIVFEPGSNNNLLMGVEDFGGLGLSGVYQTTNASTASVAGNIAPTFSRTLTLGVVNSKLAINKIGATVTALAATGESSGTLRKSTDGGATWPTTITALGATGSGFCGGQCFYDIAVALDPGDANIIYLGGSGNGSTGSVLVKTTNGTTFSRIDTGLHADSHAIKIAPSNTATVYAGNDGGIWKSVNSGGSWTSLNNTTFNATQFESIALHPSDRHFSIGGTQDNGTAFHKPDTTWTRADFGDGGFSAIDQNAPDTTNVTMYHTYFNQTNNLIGFARVTTVANASDGLWFFKGCSGGVPANGITCTDNVLFYAPLALGPGNPNTFYFGTDRLYRSTDKGDNNFVVSQAPFVAGQRVSAIGISPQDDNYRIVGLKNGKIFGTTTGATPLTDITSAGMPVKYAARTVFDPTNKNTAYVSFDGFGVTAGQHVWKTTNFNGSPPTWIAAGNGIPDVPVNALVVDPANSSNVYAGTDIGVYASTDGGVSWTPFGTGLPVVAVFDMGIQNPNRILRIATHGRGMWEMNLGTGPSLSINDVTLNEGNSGTTSFNFTVTLSPASGQTVTVSYATADGTATTAGSDYVAAFGNLTFNPGETTKQITVLVNGDTQIETNETFSVNLSNATNATISKSQGVGTITNDDLPTVTIAATDPNASETGPDTGTFTVSRTGPTTSPLTVNYTIGGTATNGSDYQTLTSPVTILAGSATATITVTPIDDVLAEGDETVIVTLAAGSGYTVGSPSSATVTIVDNEKPDTFINTGPAADTGGATNSTTAVFNFTSTIPASTFACSLDGVPFTACTSPKTYTKLKPGAHNFRVQATAGGVTDPTPASFDWIVDTVAPNTTITSAPDALTKNPVARFEFISTEVGGGFQCSLDGGAFADCTSPFVSAYLLDGKHNFQVKAVDAARNVDKSAAKAKTWTVDTTPPDTSITKKPTTPTKSTSAAFKFASTEKKSTFECKLDAAVGFTPCTSAPTFPGLSLGQHHIEVRATDAAENIDPTPAMFDWEIIP